MKIGVDHSFFKRQENPLASNYIGCTIDSFLDIFLQEFNGNLQPGYADFAKTFVIPNKTNMKYGLCEITDETRELITSCYQKRRSNELPLLVQELPLSKLIEKGLERPTAKYLFIELYSGEQLKLEDDKQNEQGPDYPYPLDYYIINVKPLMTPDEEIPPTPSTMLINALGPTFGGSGAPLDKEKYQKSVDFFSKWVYVKC